MATYAKLPSGSYRCQIRRGGIYKSKTFRLKRDAKAWAAEVEAQINQIKASGRTSPKGLSIGRLVELYIESVPAQGISKQRRLKVLASRFKSVAVAGFNGVHLQRFVDERIKEGAGGPTIAQDMAYLSSVLKWARAVKHINVDALLPSEATQALKHRGLRTTSTHRNRQVTDDELDQLEAHFTAGRSKLPMTRIMRFAVASAFRLGEILRIDIEDLDHDARTVIIRSRKDPKKKDDNDQVVPLLPEAWALALEQIGERTDGRIFPYSDDTVRDNWSRARKACGIEDLHIHDLRHLGTLKLFQMGLDIPRVALITGHKQWATLKRYTDIKPDDVHKAVKS